MSSKRVIKQRLENIFPIIAYEMVIFWAFSRIGLTSDLSRLPSAGLRHPLLSALLSHPILCLFPRNRLSLSFNLQRNDLNHPFKKVHQLEN
jgi:hypothetical protein